MPPDTALDRPAAIRAGLRALVAERGFHGTSMSAVATRAEVATGTAYVHYDSKDDLVVAAYVEAKHRLGEAAVAAVTDTSSPEAIFLQLWRGAHDHLRAHPDDAGFLVQVDASPYHEMAHDELLARGNDPLTAAVADRQLRQLLPDLPDSVLYELALGPAVRLATREPLTDEQLATVAGACWAAVTAR